MRKKSQIFSEVKVANLGDKNMDILRFKYQIYKAKLGNSL